MIKLAALLCFVLFSTTFAQSRIHVTPLTSVNPSPVIDDKLCPTCVTFIADSINDLLNIIANVGISGTCIDVCNKLPDSLEIVICFMLCDLVGFEAFGKIIEAVDPDPIYICEQFGVCPFKTNASVEVNSTTIMPTEGRQFTTFHVAFEYTVINETGTGEVMFVIIPPKNSYRPGPPFGDAVLIVAQPPGKYDARFVFEAQPSEQEPFLPGKYEIDFTICEGLCGSKHPYSYVMGKGTTSFHLSN